MHAYIKTYRVQHSCVHMIVWRICDSTAHSTAHNTAPTVSVCLSHLDLGC